MPRVKRSEEERAGITAALTQAASGQGWQRVPQGKSIRDQKRKTEGEAATVMFGPMVKQIVQFGDWVQFDVDSEVQAKSLIAAVSKAANDLGHGMRADFAQLTDETGTPIDKWGVQFKAGKRRQKKSTETVSDAEKPHLAPVS